MHFLERMTMALMAMAWLAAPPALAQNPLVERPAEVIVLDPNAFQLLGYGTMDGDVLRLEMTGRVGDFVMLLVGAEGELERHYGFEDSEGELRLLDAAGADSGALEEFFATRGIRLEVARKGSITIHEQPAPSPPVPDDDRPDPVVPDPEPIPDDDGDAAPQPTPPGDDGPGDPAPPGMPGGDDGDDDADDDADGTDDDDGDDDRDDGGDDDDGDGDDDDDDDADDEDDDDDDDEDDDDD